MMTELWPIWVAEGAYMIRSDNMHVLRIERVCKNHLKVEGYAGMSFRLYQAGLRMYEPITAERAAHIRSLFSRINTIRNFEPHVWIEVMPETEIEELLVRLGRADDGYPPPPVVPSPEDMMKALEDAYPVRKAVEKELEGVRNPSSSDLTFRVQEDKRVGTS